MFTKVQMPQMYTPEQVATFLQLKKNTVYDLIDRGELMAKKIGKVYRIPSTSLYFALTGLDYDLYLAEKEDSKSLDIVQNELTNIRKIL